MQNCLGAPSDFGLMYVFLSFLCEFEPLKLNVTLGIDFRQRDDEWSDGKPPKSTPSQVSSLLWFTINPD